MSLPINSQEVEARIRFELLSMIKEKGPVFLEQDGFFAWAVDEIVRLRNDVEIVSKHVSELHAEMHRATKPSATKGLDFTYAYERVQRICSVVNWSRRGGLPRGKP